jgi:hypothetical protein
MPESDPRLLQAFLKNDCPRKIVGAKEIGVSSQSLDTPTRTELSIA